MSEVKYDKAILEVKIVDLPLENRIKNALLKMQFGQAVASHEDITVADLLQTPFRELTKYRNIGTKGLYNLSYVLDKSLGVTYGYYPENYAPTFNKRISAKSIFIDQVPYDIVNVGGGQFIEISNNRLHFEIPHEQTRHREFCQRWGIPMDNKTSFDVALLFKIENGEAPRSMKKIMEKLNYGKGPIPFDIVDRNPLFRYCVLNAKYQGIPQSNGNRFYKDLQSLCEDFGLQTKQLESMRLKEQNHLLYGA